MVLMPVGQRIRLTEGGASVSKKLVIEVPEELAAMGEAFRAMVDRVVAANRSVAGNGRAVDYAPLEREIGALSRAVERGAHEAMLEALDIDAPRVSIDGKTWARVGRYPGTYYAKAGEVQIPRTLYREVGVRNGKTVDAVGLRAGVVGDGWLPDTAAVMAFLVAQAPSRDAEKMAEKMDRLGYSRSAFEDVAHLMGQQFAPQHKDIEDAMISAYEVPAEACSVSAALDRVSLPMEEPRVRPVGRPRKAAAKRPVARNYRMAWCGTVTLHDADGKALHTIRYGLMPYGDPVELVHSLLGDVAKLLEKRPDLKVAALADGAHDLWTLLEAWLNNEVLGVRVYYLVDFWHLMEKLGKAARVIYGKDGAASPVLRRWRVALLNNANAACDIVLELWKSGRRHMVVDDARPVHEAIRYLLNHRQRMNYAQARRAGLPIGSGNVEATCKSLVETRMKRCGSRWKDETGGHVLQLRALALSDRWDHALELTLAPLRKAVRKVG
jgi:hypothetical protein